MRCQNQQGISNLSFHLVKHTQYAMCIVYTCCTGLVLICTAIKRVEKDMWIVNRSLCDDFCSLVYELLILYTHIHRCVTVTTVTTSLVTLRWMAQWQLRKHRRCFDKPLCWRVVYLFFVHHDCDVVIYCRCLFEWLVIGHTTVHCSSGRTRVGRLQ